MLHLPLHLSPSPSPSPSPSSTRLSSPLIIQDVFDAVLAVYLISSYLSILSVSVLGAPGLEGVVWMWCTYGAMRCGVVNRLVVVWRVVYSAVCSVGSGRGRIELGSG